MTGDPFIMSVPATDGGLVPPLTARVRAFKRHLIRSLRDLRVARRPDRLIQKRTPEPEGFTAAVLRAGCAACQGHCCKGGGDHAYIDERTMARVRHEHPDLDAAAIIRRYIERLAPLAYQGSCLFHGRHGCTLGRDLRAELCNAYHCDGLQAFLKQIPVPDHVRVVARRGAIERAPVDVVRADQT